MKTKAEIRKEYKKLGGEIKFKGVNYYGTPIIVSVKNIYTGVTYVIGNTITFGSWGEKQITSFGIYDYAVLAYCGSFFTGIVHHSQKPKTYPV